jgi:hypothetical protein
MQVLEQGAGTLGWDVDKREVTIYDSGTQEFHSSTVERVTQSIVAILENLEETKNTYVFINSFTLTQNKTLSALERLQGKPYKVTHDTSAAATARGLQGIENGDVENGYPQLITGSTYDPGNFANFDADEVNEWKKILQLTDVEDFDEVLLDVLRKKKLI